jgi:hypothetical protein
MIDWVPPVLAVAIFVASIFWWHWARKASDLAIDRLKRATETYAAARRERLESYRVLVLAIQADPELTERLIAKYGDDAEDGDAR